MKPTLSFSLCAWMCKWYMSAHCKGHVHCSYAFRGQRTQSRFFKSIANFIHDFWQVFPPICHNPFHLHISEETGIVRVKYLAQDDSTKALARAEWRTLKLKFTSQTFTLGHQALVTYLLEDKHSHSTYFKICLASLAIFWGPSGGILVKLLRSLPLQ